jgi:PAS domain S-box-containing protein
MSRSRWARWRGWGIISLSLSGVRRDCMNFLLGLGPATTTRSRGIVQPIIRVAACITAVLVVVGLLLAIHSKDRPLAIALNLFLVVVLVSAIGWGARYAIFLSILAAFGFSWSLPPSGQFHLEDGRVWTVLGACLVTGLTSSYLSGRVRRALVEANQRRAEAVAEKQRFADLVNSIEGIVWEADAETFTFSFVSDQAERILGYQIASWLEPGFWRNHLHAEDCDCALNCWRQAADEKRRQDFEYRMIASDGRAVWMRDLVTVVVENGRATHLRGVMVDVTRRKRDEEAIREQANLLSLTRDAIFVRDMQGKITYWNRGAENLYGWTAEEATGKVSFELTKTMFPIPLEQIERKLMRDGRWEGELVHTKKGGTAVPVASRWSLQRDENGTPVAVLETNNDVTEQKRAAEAVRRSETQLQQVVATIPAWVFVARPDGFMEFNSQRLLEYSGISAQQTSVGAWIATVHPDDRDLHLKKWQESLSSGEPFENEARHRSKNSEYRWFLVRAVPLRDEEGNIRKWYGTIADIEDRKRAEQERERLRQAEADLAHINRVSMMGELAASLGHEIKQPIAAAIMNANTCLRWLRREQPDLEEARAAASRSVEDAMRAVEIVNRTSSLFKKGAAERSLVHINGVIDELIALLQHEAARFNISIRRNLASNVPPVLGDQVQLQQVLMNLVINGIDAVKGVDGPREITIASQADADNQLLVSVSDTGVGLPPKIDKLFDAFFTTKPNGTGMGLAISRTIVESHGGRLSAMSNGDRGARFNVTLPAARAEASGAQA